MKHVKGFVESNAILIWLAPDYSVCKVKGNNFKAQVMLYLDN